MANGKRDVYKELAWDDWEAYSRMRNTAHIAGKYMRESWKRPSNRYRHIERMALWSAVLLDIDCGEALKSGHELRLWPPDVSPQTRYGLQASVRMVHATLPFTAEERQALSEGPLHTFNETYPETESKELAAHEPELVERWHEWLWLDELGQQQRDVTKLGASAILAEGCGQVFVTVHSILSDPLATPL